MSLQYNVYIMNCPNCSDGGLVINQAGCHTCQDCGWSACPSG